ncbi:MAG: type II toxin-antitoxin system RelE/ParE family toxin [bacterium]
MRYEFHSEALEEYQQAVNWYASKRTDLALGFVEAIEQAVARIAEAPERWRVIEEDVHRCLTRVFPYGILYTMESDYILILAITHCSREPRYWKGRLR